MRYHYNYKIFLSWARPLIKFLSKHVISKFNLKNDLIVFSQLNLFFFVEGYVKI
jgi:hypothetical protein